MQVIIYLSRFFVLVVFTGSMFAGESSYRLAGIIAPADTRWMAVIEMPNDKQQLVHEGDALGEAKVLRISKGEVLLGLKDGTQLLKLASSESDQQSLEAANSGVPANKFLQIIKETPELSVPGELPGLVDMNQLPTDIHIVSINGKKIISPEAGLQIIQDAISNGSLIRLTLEEGASVPIIYLRPGIDTEEGEAM